MEVVMRKLIQVTSDVGAFMKEVRERQGLTQEKVSMKSGFTTQTIANLEKNKGSMNMSTLLAIATSIGVKVELNFEDKQNVKIREL
jgi:transcriptional regulator with XRE-family HTH domain